MAHSPPPPPQLLPYWFYTSALLIDDPLSPLPATQPTTNQPPRPFSRYDCNNLERAYQQLIEDHQRPSSHPGDHKHAPSREQSPPPALKRTKSREAAFEGHPEWNPHDDELQLRDEISLATRTPVVLLESAPMDRAPSNTSGLSGSPLCSFFASSSVPTYSYASTFTIGSESTAANITKNPFIRSYTYSRTSPTTQASSQPCSRRSSITSKKAPLQQAPPAPVTQKEIPVGIQRLHKVLLPSFVMLAAVDSEPMVKVEAYE